MTFGRNGDLVSEPPPEAISAGTRQVAFLQEPTVAPSTANSDRADDLPLDPGDSEQAANGKVDNDEAGTSSGNDDEQKDDSLAGAEKLGEEPEDRSLDFLRTQTVLLKPGENQFDVGLTYLLTETEFPILLTDGMGSIVSVDEVNFRVRELTVPMEYRVGLLKRVQGFVGAPVGWSNTQVAIDSFDAFENDGGLGDVSFGLTAQLVDATANCPYVIGTLSATAPTGGDPFTNVAGLAPTAPSLGQGFWSISGNLVFIQQYDPVVIFYGLGTEQFFSRHLIGLDIEPGAQYNYQFGVGFAVNERITLSTRFFGAYVEEIKTNGNRRFGTNAEPMSIRLSATISQPCDRLVEPFVEFGITDDAVSSFFGISWTFSPKSHRETKPNQAAPTKPPAANGKDKTGDGKA